MLPDTQVDLSTLPASMGLPCAIRESANIFAQLKRDFAQGKFPWVGDVNDFTLGYITFASVLHAWVDSVASPVGSFVIGSTSSGKTQFLEVLCRLFPDEMVINLTTVSSRSLIYQCKDNPYYLNGKVVFVEELAGLQDEEVQYLLRILLTKGRARHTTVHGGEVQVISIIGGISLQSTGLKQDVLRDDTMNRLVLFRSDDSNAMSEKVIDNIKRRYVGGDNGKSTSYAPYKDFFRTLRPYTVSIPYADRIRFKIANTESRRSAKIFMDLLATVALLNQFDREIDEKKKVVISQEEDFQFLFDLIARDDSITDKGLNRCERAVYEVALRLQSRDCFTFQDVLSEKPGYVPDRFDGYGMTSVKVALQQLSRLDLLEANKIGKRVHFKLSADRLSNGWGVVGLV